MKNIFICTDGTWNSTLQLNMGQLAFTNVAKLARTILTTKSQIVYYDRGVGTNDFLDKPAYLLLRRQQLLVYPFLQ